MNEFRVDLYPNTLWVVSFTWEPPAVPRKPRVFKSRLHLQQALPSSHFHSVWEWGPFGMVHNALSISYLRFFLKSISLYLPRNVPTGGQATVFLLLKTRPPQHVPWAWGLGTRQFSGPLPEHYGLTPTPYLFVSTYRAPRSQECF